MSDRRAGSRCRRAACSWRRPASDGSADRTVGRRSSVRHGSGRCAPRRWRRLANTSCRPDTSPARWRCRARRRTALNRHDTHTHTPTDSQHTAPTIYDDDDGFYHDEYKLLDPEDPGSNHTTDGCLYRDSCCDIQLGHRLRTFTAVPRSTQPSTLCGAVIITMAMVDVDGSCQYSANSHPKSTGLI